MFSSYFYRIFLVCLNPYSNGTMYLIKQMFRSFRGGESLNPYSNGTMYLIL